MCPYETNVLATKLSPISKLENQKCEIQLFVEGHTVTFFMFALSFMVFGG
jgi:hypothetical protein